MEKQEFKIKEVNIGENSEKNISGQVTVDPQIVPEMKNEIKLQNPKTIWLKKLFNKKTLIKTLVVIILLCMAFAAVMFFLRGGNVDLEKVRVNIPIPNSVSSGEVVTLKIDYINENKIALNDAYLTINYPAGTYAVDGKEIFQERKSIGNIEKKSNGSTEVKVRFVGEKGDIKTVEAKIDFQPQNIGSSRFEKSTVSRIEINSILVAISVEGSEKAISGQEANYLITLENKTEEDIRGLKIELTYDKDFKFGNAQPIPLVKTNNIWQIDILKAGEKRSINLIGTLNGNEGESKALKVVAGRIENEVFIKYSQLEYLTLIAPSPLLLNLVLENTEEDCRVDPGQLLKYRIDFKNNADVSLSELILKVHLKDGVFNLRNIQLGSVGFFDSRENTITWSGGDIPALKLLKSNESGEVSFSIPLKKPIPMVNYNDKNLLVEVSAEIGTKTVPAKFAVDELKITRDLSCKINSSVGLKTKGYFNEPNSKIINSGPIPPRVNALTTYTIHWQIVNGSNDLDNVVVKSVLPQGIAWTNNYINSVPNSQVFYNERTKELVWQIPKLLAGVGYILQAYEVIFQVGLTPSINQIGTTPSLINESFLEGKDSFTGLILNDSTSEITTSVPDDPQKIQGNVRE